MIYNFFQSAFYPYNQMNQSLKSEVYDLLPINFKYAICTLNCNQKFEKDTDCRF